MHRSICIVFVVLAACQVAFARNLELTNEPSPKVDLFDGEKSPELLGDMSAGEHMAGETIYTFQHWVESEKNRIANIARLIIVPKEKKIHYVKAVSTNGPKAVICKTEYTLGSYFGFINVRQPPNSKSLISITVGAH